MKLTIHLSVPAKFISLLEYGVIGSNTSPELNRFATVRASTDNRKSNPSGTHSLYSVLCLACVRYISPTREFAVIFFCLISFLAADAQLLEGKTKFTRSDTLRGSITAYRKGWDVMKYDLTVQPDIPNKTITGKNIITYREALPVHTMQIDLQQPLIVDSIVGENNTNYRFTRDSNVCWVHVRDSLAQYKFLPGVRKITVWYHGVPVEAKRPPWDGGLIWKTDDNGNPFIGTACQGFGASVWWPCKDHQSDEPDSGMTITIIAPDTLMAVSNGRLTTIRPYYHRMKSWTWEVKNPINSYAVTMNIGKYATWTDTLMGKGGRLDLQYWVLRYNYSQAKKQFNQVKPVLRSHEYWFGKYPFYDDGYKLVEAPFLGMEHQSAIAYGNNYQNGYRGKDLSGTGVGLIWDFIIVHESGHEWFGNSITTNDIADMWVHEGFTNYSEVLYMETLLGKEIADAYCLGIRKNIKNDRPVTGEYDVNEEGSGDMYYKASNMLHIIRQVINDDEKFREILKGLNVTFYHKTVTAKQVEDYFYKKTGTNLYPIFDQYLRTTRIPRCEYYLSGNKIFFRWINTVKNLYLPLRISSKTGNLTLVPGEEWDSEVMPGELASQDIASLINKQYYIEVRKVKSR